MKDSVKFITHLEYDPYCVEVEASYYADADAPIQLEVNGSSANLKRDEVKSLIRDLQAAIREVGA